jgi:Salmonella virulence plasmid 65kDa B protein
MHFQQSLTALLLLSLLAPSALVPLTAHAEETGYNVPVNVIEGGQQKTISIAPESNTGAAVYQIPLVTPPGRNGIEASLALSYNSGMNDNTSIYGYGWNVAIPSISRVNKDGANKLYTQNDFSSSIDGELVLVTSGSPSVYRPRYDSGSFNKYI